MFDIILNKINRFVPVRWRWILGHEGFKRYLANTGWMFFGQMFGLLLSFFIGVWVVRYLGPENYGVLSYALAFTTLFSFIASLGVDSILNRELVKFPEKRDELMGTAFRLKLIGGIIAFIVTIGAIFLVKTSPVIKFLVIIHSFVFLFYSINVIGSFFQSRVEARKNVKAQIIASSISSLLKIFMILSGLGVIWLMLIYMLDALWLAIVLIISYRRSGFKIKAWRFNKALARQIFSSSWVLMLTTASILVYLKIDQVIIKQILDETAVGLYSAAIKLSEIWYFIPGIICGSLFPAIINSKKTSQTSYFRRLKKLTILMTSTGFAIALVVSLLARPIILILFGGEYFESISVLSIYAWSIIGIFLGSVSFNYLIAENYVKIYFWVSFLGALSNIILNLWLIPIMGINGAAVATVISYSLVVLGLLFFNKSRKDLILIAKS